MFGTLTPVTARFRLRELLERHEISQSDFARRADLSFATVNRVCTNATAQVSLETLDKLLVALESYGIKATLDDLIERAREKGRRGRT
ncbi:MAG: helix-turn-helix domain-containing protein [Gemmatimonadaceae bacterium]